MAAAATAAAASLKSAIPRGNRVVCALQAVFWPVFVAMKVYEYRVVLIWALYGTFVLYPTEFFHYLLADSDDPPSLNARLRQAFRTHTRLAWKHFQVKDFRLVTNFADRMFRIVLSAWALLHRVVSLIRPLPQLQPPVKVHKESFCSVRDGSSIQIDWFYSGKNAAHFQLQRLDAVVLMLHGGAFGFGTPMTSSLAIGALIDMCADAGIEIGVAALRYGFAPESSFPTQLNEVTDAFAQYLVDHCGVPADRIVFLGCSAGANLAIASNLLLRGTGAAMPAGIVSISPWLDLTCKSSMVSPNVAVDTLCDVAKLQAYAKRYSRELSPRKGLISPVYAELHGLPPQLVCVGSREVFLDECKKFVEAVKKADSEVELTIGRDCTHMYPVMKFVGGVESLIALHKIGAFIVRCVRKAANLPGKPLGYRLTQP